jgi:hypothetical protein
MLALNLLMVDKTKNCLKNDGANYIEQFKHCQIFAMSLYSTKMRPTFD